MNRDLVLAEWRRAGESLRAAELLARENFTTDAVAKTYYAVFHAAKAALEVHDVSSQSHSGVRRMFGLHLIRSGEIEPEWASHLGQSLDDRLAADYNPQIVFSGDEARETCRLSRQFVRRIRRYLLSKGFTESQLRRRKRG